MTFKPDDIRTYEYLIERKSTTVGFEPTRVNPLDFKSNTLTTRPSCHIYLFRNIGFIKFVKRIYLSMLISELIKVERIFISCVEVMLRCSGVGYLTYTFCYIAPF